MATNNSQFKTIYWDDEKSSSVQFQPFDSIPPHANITACMVFAVSEDNQVVLSKPARGWGILGGRLEEGETTEDCARREAMEEAAVELGELKLIGGWKATKLFETSFNKRYPDIGYQLLYIADISKVLDFKPNFETSERIFTPIENVKNIHHGMESFDEVLRYIINCIV